MRGTVAKRMRRLGVVMVRQGHRQYDGLRARQIHRLLTTNGIDPGGPQIRRLAGGS